MDIAQRHDELELLGLTPSEKKVIVAISKMGKTPSMISRQTDIPRTTINDILKKLQKKSYVWPVMMGKRKHWRSNIPKILQYIQNLKLREKR